MHLYSRVDDEIRREVEAALARQFPQLNVSVGAARLIKDRGIAIHDLMISETAANGLQSNLLVVEEIMLNCQIELQQLFRGPPPVSTITIKHPEVWLARETDGSWNLETFWPLPSCGLAPPKIIVEDARVTIVDHQSPQAAPISLRDVDLKFQAFLAQPPTEVLTAESDSPPAIGSFKSEGSFAGPHVSEASFTAQGNLCEKSIEISTQFTDLDVNSDLVEWLASVGLKLPNDLRLQCKTSGELTVAHRLGSGSPPAITASARINQGRLKHPRLPHTLTELSCDVTASANLIRISALHCNCGSAGIALQLERHGWQPDAPLTMAMRAENVALDKKLYASMPELIRNEWDKYQPTGNVDADLQLVFDGQAWRPNAELTGHDLAFESDKFAYRLHNGSGTLRYDSGSPGQHSVLNLDLVGHGGGQPIHITGQVFDPGPGAPGWVEIKGDNLEIEDAMIAALPGKSREVIGSLHPEGHINVHWRIDKTLPGQLKPYTSLRLELAGCRVNYDKFPYPLSGIRGVIQAEDNRWKFHNLVSGGSRNVTCEGSLQPGGQGIELALQFIGKEIPFDDELRQALSPSVRQAWDELRPHGRIDLVAEIYHTTGLTKPSIRVQISPRPQSASIQPKFFPYLMENLAGSIDYQNGHVLLTSATAQHERTTVRTNGHGEFRSDGSWDFRLEGLTVDRLSPRRDLIVAMPPKMQKVIDLLQPSGSDFGISNATVSFAKSAEPNTVPTSMWDLQLHCTGARLQTGIDLENIHGTVRLQGYCDGTKCEQAGELQLDTATVQDVQFTEVRGPLWIDETSCQAGRWACEKLNIAPRNLTAKAYDGTIYSDAWVTFEQLPHYRVEASIANASLTRMMIERFQSQQAFNGKVSASLEVWGTGRSRQTLEGKGEVSITEANIYELPLLVGLLKVLRNGSPDTTAFNQSEMKFRIDGSHVYLDQLDFLGDAVSLYGQGTTNFDQDLNLVFHGVVGRNDLRLPLVKSIMDRAGRGFMQMYVTGTMSAPEFHTQALPGINQLIQQIQDELDTVTPATRVRQADRNRGGIR